MAHQNFDTALATIPAALRSALSETFTTIIRNYRENRWEPSELNGGKFCEVVYSILRGHVDRSFPAKPSKPRNMVDACKALEQHTANFPRAITIQIPRMLIALYEIRNNRGVGHVGGDVDPNQMDARVVLEMAKWILADLIRIFHPNSVSIQQASAIVDTIVERTVPAVWQIGDIRRVLDPSLPARSQTLMLLYAASGPVNAGQLYEWVEYSSLGNYKRDVLRKAHVERLIEFNEETQDVTLSPNGVREVETSLPLQLPA